MTYLPILHLWPPRCDLASADPTSTFGIFVPPVSFRQSNTKFFFVRVVSKGRVVPGISIAQGKEVTTADVECQQQDRF